MSPEQLAKSGTEHAEQVALFAWLTVATAFGVRAADDKATYTKRGYASETYGTQDAVPELKWVHAIPNGGSRGSTKEQAMRVGVMLKAEGVRSGVSDIFVPIPRHGLHGLYIELKKADGGSGLSPAQKEFGAFVQGQGYGFCQANGWRAGADIIRQWLK